MTPDELSRQEEAAREAIRALSRLSSEVRVSPDFLAHVMARAEQLPEPRGGLWQRVRLAMTAPLSPAMRVVALVVFLLALAGAIPQYATWIKAYTWGVPSEAVHEAKVQERLWRKNFACATQLDRSSSNYTVLTADSVDVVVWGCPSGDVLVTVQSSQEPSRQRHVWIALDTLRDSEESFSFLVQQAFAAEKSPRGKRRSAHVVRVLCQKWLPKRFIQRRVQFSDGRCRDEVINPRNGKVTRHKEAACEPTCAGLAKLP